MVIAYPGMGRIAYPFFSCWFSAYSGTDGLGVGLHGIAYPCGKDGSPRSTVLHLEIPDAHTQR